MLSTLRPRSIYDVFALLALVVAVGGTSAYAANTVFSSDIVDGEVKSVDIGNNEIASGDIKDNTVNTFDVHSFIGEDVIDGTLTGPDIANGTLNDEDVGQVAFVNFAANVPAVGAHQCFSASITGTGAAEGDHLLLTPSSFDSPALADSNLVYSVRYGSGSSPEPRLWACNPTNGGLPALTTHFSLLVIDGN
jgi:hypothetical protein